MSLKKCETVKLHYRKYLYKLVLSNSLSDIFRTERQKGGELGYTREKLDHLTQQYVNGESLHIIKYRSTREVSTDEYLDARDVYTTLKDSVDYKIRTSYTTPLIIYSNDKDMLLKIAGMMRSSAREFWEPSERSVDLLTSNCDVIVVDSLPILPLKVNLKNGKINKDFAVWLKANNDKCRVGPVTLNDIEVNGWVYGSYIHVRDEKILNLVTLLIGSNIRNVQKLVYKGDIDKYMYVQ